MGRQAVVNFSLSLKATTAWSVYHLIGFDGAQASVAGQKVLGAARTDAVNGQEATVDIDDTVLVVAGSAFSPGDALTVDAQGRAVPASSLQVAAGATSVTSTAANGAVLTGGILPEFIFADALEAASAAGDIVEVITRW